MKNEKSITVDIECPVCCTKIKNIPTNTSFKCPECDFDKFVWDQDQDENFFIDFYIKDVKEFQKTCKYKENIREISKREVNYKHQFTKDL